MTPEGIIKRALDKGLKEAGIWYFSPQSGPYGKSGIPDRVLCVNRIFVGIECKADPSKKPTALQSKCMRDIEEAGGFCFVVDNEKSLRNVLTFVEDLKKATVSVNSINISL